MVRFKVAGLLVVIGLGAPAVQAWAQVETLPPIEPFRASGYKVAFWYDRSHPAQTFRYRAYNLSKGEFDSKAVDRWLELMRTQFPGMMVYVRDAPPARQAGDDGFEALMEMIEQERDNVGMTGRREVRRPPLPSVPLPPPLASSTPEPAATSSSANQAAHPQDATNYVPAANYEQLMHPSISGYLQSRPTSRFSTGLPTRSSTTGFGFSGTSSPPSSSFPVPYPYPRPHP